MVLMGENFTVAVAPHFGLDAPWEKKKNHRTATVASVPLARSA